MGQLLKKTIHDCKPPTPTEQHLEHKWTCDGCGQEWAWSASYAYRIAVSYGFLGLRERTETRAHGGRWHLSGESYKRARWEQA
jgi:hypothetical protein